MLFSGIIMKNAVENYKSKENYKHEKKPSLVYLVLATLLLVIEFMVLFYAITIALSCGESNAEKFLHVILALFFTLPYLTAMLIFQPCAKKSINFSFNDSFSGCGMPN